MVSTVSSLGRGRMAALARLLVLGGFPEATAGMESFLEIYEFGIGKFPSALEHQCTKKLPGPLAKLTCWKCKCFFFFFGNGQFYK